jgi:hypothetical protein
MRNKGILTFLLLLINVIIIYANNTHANINKEKLRSQTIKVENFNFFFDKFISDKSIQFSRTIFPLKTVYKSDEGTKTKIVKKTDWKYTNYNKIKKLITNKTIISKNEIEVVFQIEDTGINVTYQFKNINGLWWLSSTTDESD